MDANQHPKITNKEKGIDANNYYIDGQGESPIQLFKNTIKLGN